MSKHMKLMADYGCFPLWDLSPETGPGNIDPAQLPISGELKEALMNWAETYDRTLNREEPLKSGTSQAEQESFSAAAYSLASRLRNELGPDVKVDVQI